jgi:Flp pilus assembly protein TadD
LRRSICAVALVGVYGCSTPEGGDRSDDFASADQTEQINASLLLAAEASERSGDWTSAADYWASLLSKDPTNPRYSLGLGTALRHVSHYTEATQVLREALLHHPDDPALIAAYGKALLSAGSQEEALQELQRAAAMMPSDWRIQSALGVAYGMADQSALADQHYRQALTLSPDNPAILNNYALHKALSGDLPVGLDLMERAVDSVDATSQMRQNLALLLAISGDLGRAEMIVRSEMSTDAADRQMDFLESVAGADLEVLENYVGQGVVTIESETLQPPSEAETVVNLTNIGEAGDENFLDEADEVVVIDAVEFEMESPAVPIEVEVISDGAAVTTASEDIDVLPPVIVEPAAEPAEMQVVEIVETPTADAVGVVETDQTSEVADGEIEQVDTSALTAALEDQGLSGTLLVVATPTGSDAESLSEPVVDEALSSPPLEQEVLVSSTFVETEPVPSDGPVYRVQLAALGTQAAAEAGRAKLEDELSAPLGSTSLDVREGTTSEGAPTWRIFAGAFAQRDNAEALCASIKADGGDCYVRRD